MVKSYLESFDIECFGMDEFVNRTYVASVNGGIKLAVKESQLDEAITILRDAGYLTQADFEPSAKIKWVDKLVHFFSKENK
jgi:type III secretory pathway lipoprotein EscJ